MCKTPTLILIMGVSGSGKTTLARTLSEKLHWSYLEADSFHSPDAVEKMRLGTPLTDEDREPWIGRLAQRLCELSTAGQSCILAYSGLRREHRTRLANTGFSAVFACLLEADPEILKQRLENRNDHFMPASLLQSQLDTLEPPLPEESVNRLIGGEKSIPELLSEILNIMQYEIK